MALRTGQREGRTVQVQIDIVMSFTTNTKKPTETKSGLWKRLFWRK